MERTRMEVERLRSRRRLPEETFNPYMSRDMRRLKAMMPELLKRQLEIITLDEFEFTGDHGC